MNEQQISENLQRIKLNDAKDFVYSKALQQILNKFFGEKIIILIFNFNFNQHT
jgi:hypothetical protein